jgi:hypothetical protein
MKLPYRLSPEAIKEFEQIYSKEFGRSLTHEDAQQMAIDVLLLFDLFLTPGRKLDPPQTRTAGSD